MTNQVKEEVKVETVKSTNTIILEKENKQEIEKAELNKVEIINKAVNLIDLDCSEGFVDEKDKKSFNLIFDEIHTKFYPNINVTSKEKTIIFYKAFTMAYKGKMLEFFGMLLTVISGVMTPILNFSPMEENILYLIYKLLILLLYCGFSYKMLKMLNRITINSIRESYYCKSIEFFEKKEMENK